MAKKEEIKIPQSVFDRSNQEFRRGEQSYETGSMFTPKEARTIGLPTFPFGGISETSLDVGSRSPSRTNPTRDFLGAPFNNPDVQYERDSQSRMANRYTMPLSDLGLNNYKSGEFRSELPTSRVGVTAYSDPVRSASIGEDNLFKGNTTFVPESPNVGQQGFTRGGFTNSGGRVEQILSPAGFASTILNPEQDIARNKSRYQAEQTGTMPRTPQQQQELLAQMRTRGATIRESIASNARDSFGTKTPAQTYTTPSGSSIVAPTNMFGRPIQSFSDVYAARSPINEAALARMGRGSSAPTNSGILSPTGFGGGPQPASPMLTGNSMVGRTRKRLFGTV